MNDKEDYSKEDWEIIDAYHWYVSRALWDEVIPSLRKVRLEWDSENHLIRIFFYHDGPLTEAVKDHYAYIESEVDCDDMGRKVKIEAKIVRVDYPNLLPKQRFIIYARKEPFEDPS